jgi:hypothetical protein
MTFAEWVKTAERKTDLSILENAFGFEVENAVAAIVYDPGVVAELSDGQFFTLLYTNEYTGTREEIEKVLWEDYAEKETRE